jgi:4-hydroxymandelate oxidase
MDVRELEERARGLLSPQAYDYYAGGADDERTLAENIEAWSRMRLRPRVLRDVSRVSTDTTLLGEQTPTPVLVAPTAVHRLASDDGEAATARGAADAGSVFTLSTLSSMTIEEVAQAVPESRKWFQVYCRRDRGSTDDLVRRAADAGYEALVATVDMPVLGHRRRDGRHPPGLPDGVELVHFERKSTDDDQWLALTIAEDLDPTLTFDEISRIASLTALPVVVKGVLRGDDAARCVAAGAAGIIVSNHGGRQLDTAVSGAEALPEVVEAVGGQADVLVDGGIRSGTDALKALALGARAVLVGRPLLWALTVGGHEGVRSALDEYRVQLARAMALCGAPRVEDLTPDLVVR